MNGGGALASLRLGAMAATLLACSPQESAPAPKRAELPEGVVARVGALEIAASTVRAIASAQRLAPTKALELAISDALFAAAVSADPGRRDLASVVRRSVHARALLAELEAAARAEGPPTDDEVERLTRARWVELDRPESVRTVHFVARVQNPMDEERVRRVAEQVAAEVASADDAKAFLGAVRALMPKAKEEGVELRVETLPFLTPQGKPFDPSAPGPPPDQQFDLTFTQAAHALERPGEQSPVVKTPFGYHVILLVERLPEQRLTLDERRALVEEDVYGRRVQVRTKRLVEELSRATPSEVSRAADELTAKVVVAP